MKKSKSKNLLIIFWKNLNFKFQNNFLIDIFLIKLTQLGKIGSINKFVIPLENLKI